MAADGGRLLLEECRASFEAAERIARSLGIRDLEVITGSQAEALTRFSNNAIHQNVFERSHSFSVRVFEDQRTARATTNRLDEDSLRCTVENALALTRASAPDPALPALQPPEPIQPVARFDAAVAEATPEHRAGVVAEAIRIVESEGQIAAGIYSTGQSSHAIFNTNGVAAFHAETVARFSITAMASDSSGWAKAPATHLNELDPLGLAASAARKAADSAAPVELPPGRYTVVLEPAAVLDLVGQMFGDFSGTALLDQRSFLNRRIGEPLFGENITIHDDVYHPMQSGEPFDGEGGARRRLTLVDRGRPLEVAYSRTAARKAGVAATGHGFALPNEAGEAPFNIVIAGGQEPVHGMIASTARGILVTRLWYIREVDPYEKIMTGMTRDGAFLIEDGRVVRGIRNFRFNQGLIDLLRNVDALSPAVRASGEEAFDMVVPAMKVRDFHFTEVTRF